MKKYFSTYLSAVSIIALTLVVLMNIFHAAFGNATANAADACDSPTAAISESEDTHTNEHTEKLKEEVSVSSVDISYVPLNDKPDDKQEDKQETYYYYMTDEDIRDFAALVFLEAGAEPEEVKYAVGSVILNRMVLWDMSFNEVAYQKNQFSPASLIDSTEARDVEINIVKDLLKNGPTIDKYVCYFRASYYHDWKGMNDYNYFGGNTYFSYSDIDYDRYFN